MAPPNQLGKRMKGVQISRPFIYGTTARPFDEKTNPKPPTVPDGHTHSWQVFIKGVDDTDITYWLRRVQFKLHESIPNHVRMIEGEKGKAFIVNETGWGEFEITIKLYYSSESGEKAQTLYHHLRLHPYGKNDDEKARSRQPNGDIVAWNYEEQLFNEPYEVFYNILTSGAAAPSRTGNASTASTPAGKKQSAAAAAAAANATPDPASGIVYERSALVPQRMTAEQPFSRETEDLERDRITRALDKVVGWIDETKTSNLEKEKLLAELRAENAAAAASGPQTKKAGA